jgi:flagellar motor switch protein FliN
MRLGRIGEVMVPVEVVLGRTTHRVEDVAQIGPGTIIALESIAGEPVELRAGGEVIGMGEVVIIDEHFGLRVTSVITGHREEDRDGNG